MKRILTKTCLLLAALLIPVMSFSQQGQMNSGNKTNPSNAGNKNVQGQTMQNPVDSTGQQIQQKSQNDDYRPQLQPGESYPVNQNLEINKENLIHSLDDQKSGMGVQNDQDQVTPGAQSGVTPGVQNQGNPAQSSQPNQGSQSVPGKTGKGETNQINPGINNNPGVPNDQGTQNPANIQKDKPKKTGQNAGQSQVSGQGNRSVPGDSASGKSKQINPGINNNNPAVPNDQGTQNPANIQKDKGKPE